MNELHFTQDSIAETFSCGTSLKDTLQQLRSQEVDPLGKKSESWLTLKRVQVDGRIQCNGNRRLWCLNGHQKSAMHVVIVRVEVTNVTIPDVDINTQPAEPIRVRIRKARTAQPTRQSLNY